MLKLNCCQYYISNNASFRLKHLGVPDSSDGSDGTSNPLTENCIASAKCILVTGLRGCGV